MTAGVVGLGIIGGSFARSIKARTEHRVLVRNRTASVIEEAIAAGAADGCLTDEALGECDVLIIALPPSAAVAWAEEKGRFIKKGAAVTDVCGVKRAVVPQLEKIARDSGFFYIGGHPMAGKETAGFKSSSEALFNGASMILTPTESSDPGALETLREFCLSIGFGRVTVTTPEHHDRVIAYTSQLCHVASSAFIKSPVAQNHLGFSAGSFRDLTRVAKLDEKLWTELFFHNSDMLAGELRLYIENLQKYLAALEGGDRESMESLLREGRLLKEASKRNVNS